jgi:transcriptional regulator with XRE-family HTH domain
MASGFNSPRKLRSDNDQQARSSANRHEQGALQSLLRQLRTDPGLRQKDIAQALGRPQAFVSYYETGARRLDLLELHEFYEVRGISLGVFGPKFERLLAVHSPRVSGWKYRRAGCARQPTKPTPSENIDSLACNNNHTRSHLNACKGGIQESNQLQSNELPSVGHQFIRVGSDQDQDTPLRQS